jgi:hypothetical protein
MKKFNSFLKSAALGGAICLASSPLIAGNEDRVGSAGASQLLVNPWARSLAAGSSGVAYTTGLEAQFMNIAGLAFTDRTQMKFNFTNWLGNAGVQFYAAGLAQRVSDQSVIAVSIQSMNFGDIPRTFVDNPEGDGSTFSPTYNIFNVGYAREFSNRIYGGINFKVNSEGVDNLRATGVAMDAGIRYVTGEREHIKFGIALKNIGPVMRYRGDGLAYEVSFAQSGSSEPFTLEQRSAAFEMPSSLSIGGAYDFFFGENQKLTAAFDFLANSFSYDNYSVGLDYAFTNDKNFQFNIRGGYIYENGILSSSLRRTALTGLTAGFSLDGLVGPNKTPIGFEYAVRLSSPFGPINTFGLTISLK